MTRILKVNPGSPEELPLTECARVILSGGVVVYPTETLYGIGGDATNAVAVAGVLRAKKRKENKPLLVIIHSVDMLQHLVAEIPATADRLMKEFWPGPLTLVFKAVHGLPDALTQSGRTIGVRVPSNAFCLELIRRCNCPLVSTSANVSGEPVHRSIKEIQQALNEGVDLFIDAGVLPESKPSTVVSVVGQTPQLIREGVISFDAVRTIVPNIKR